MSDIGLASSGNGLFRVTITQDDLVHTWTALHIVNQDAVPWTVSGSIHTIPFSVPVQPSMMLDHLLSPPLGLITITNSKGNHVLVPSLDGTTPLDYSLGVERG